MSQTPTGLNLPGSKEATDLGYEVHSHSGDRKSAEYVKGPLFLRIWTLPNGKLEASLTAMHGIVKLEVGPFAFPHQHLTSFAVKILKLLPEGA